MREILFRGKQTDSGMWVYGWYEMYPFGRWPLKSCIVQSEKADCGAYEHTEVNSSTVGQYTGLTDKNGVKIFEGDIAKTKTTSCEFVGHIVYSAEYVRFICITKSDREFPMDSRFGYEVIGNIHDNPELLREE